MGNEDRTLRAEVEIAASPEVVRSTLMDFASWNHWSSWKAEAPAATKEGRAPKTGDSMKVDLNGMKFSPTVVTNTKDGFEWLGQFYGLLDGKHVFTWKPSQNTPGWTTMVQEEEMVGLFSFMFKPGWSARTSTLKNWDAWFQDLKKESERRAAK